MRDADSDGNAVWETQYLDESKGLPLTTVWNDIKQVYADPRAYKKNQSQSVELMKDFSGGQKPEKLLQRVIEMSSDPNDLVLDYHAGTGTTLAVAHKMNRQYIGVEQMDYIRDLPEKRLKHIISGDQSGISKDVNWKDGGSFVYLELKKHNQIFIDKIEETKNTDQLLKIWDEMKEKSFLNYNVDIKKQDENLEDFKTLSFEQQKQHLLEILDKNQLYVNLSSLEDKDFACSKEERLITKDFYQIKN